MPEPRPSQQKVLRYRSGKMGVSAVPGSGKTFTLARLAADLVTDHIRDDQEVLVVTLVNSAVDNVSARIDKTLAERDLIPRLGYRVRTLHGLAHDIVRERPGLVSLAEDFQIIDERESTRILEDCCESWMKTHPDIIEEYAKQDIGESKLKWLRRDRWPELVRDITRAFIKQAKDQLASPEVLWSRLVDWETELPLASMATAIYFNYQQALAYRGSVDFDDLIRLALEALRMDSDYLQRLRDRWVYILEDEAQDSSALQEKILRKLAGDDGNWVRVGDPNQAIFETFTTASPDFLKNFLNEKDVVARELPESGRSCQSIIDLANHLIDWVMKEHPAGKETPEEGEEEHQGKNVRESLSPPYIQPTPSGDGQPNPAGGLESIHLMPQGFTADEEISWVVDSVEKWLGEHPKETVAILVPRNTRGFKMVEALRGKNVPYLELLQSTTSTRQTAGSLGNVLNYLADPTSPSKLAAVFRVWRRHDREDPEANVRLKRLAKQLRQCRRVEDYLWPRFDRDWLASLDKDVDEETESAELLEDFRNLVRRWQRAVLLPVDQLILTLAQDLFHEPVDLALAYKLALLLRDASDAHPDWGLVELTEELAMIARNQRKFIGLSGDDTAFEPDKYPGKVIVATMHKAKGLEWDRVYLVSVNNYDFPSAQSYDSYIAERWFIRDELNLEAECLSQLECALGGELYREGDATQQARLDYVAERLRLLYVGITRARKELVITWNKGTNPRQPARQAVPLIALQAFQEEQQEAAPKEEDET